jgi:hypothetical protein
MPQSDMLSGTISISDIIKSLIWNGIVPSQDYLSGSEFGAEPQGGSGSVLVNNLSYQWSGTPTIEGTPGNDTFNIAVPGGNHVEGNGGIDTVVYNGSHSQFQIKSSGSEILVTENNNISTLDVLDGVTYIKFSDGTFNTVTSTVTSTFTPTSTTITAPTTVTYSANNTILTPTVSNDAVILSGSNDTINLTGSNDAILLSGSNDSLTITGSGNRVNVSGSNDLLSATGVVAFSGGSHDTILGFDTGFNGSGYNTIHEYLDFSAIHGLNSNTQSVAINILRSTPSKIAGHTIDIVAIGGNTTLYANTTGSTETVSGYHSNVDMQINFVGVMHMNTLDLILHH